MDDVGVWRIIARHYGGSIDPPSLLAQKMFAVALDIRNALEIENHDFYEGLLEDQYREICRLANEVRELRGEPPLPPVPIA